MNPEFKIWFNKPAPDSLKYADWQRWSLPIGNGYAGANIFGHVHCERMQISEETLWTGGPIAEGGAADYCDFAAMGLTGRQNQIYDCSHYIAARDAGLAKSPNQTIPPENQPINDHLQPTFPPGREPLGNFQNFAEVFYHFKHEGKTMDFSQTNNYMRFLNIEDSVARVSYNLNGVNYTREIFASYPDNVIVTKIEADSVGKIEFTLNPTVPHSKIEETHPQSGPASNYGKDNISVIANAADKTIALQGNLRQNGLKFAAKFQVITDGLVTSGTIDNNGTLTVASASYAIVIMALGTNYINNFELRYRNPDLATPEALMDNISNRLSNAAKKGYATLRDSHIADYKNIFNRSTLTLGGTSHNLPTDKLLANYQQNGDDKLKKSLEELYFQYGRYLLISSSREGSLPANLQGVWNQQAFPAWQSDYHLNINLQMNYWPANNTNMRETLYSLITYMESLRKPGRIAAHNIFGAGGGNPEEAQCWMFNLSSNPFGFVGFHNWHGKDTDPGHPHYSPECTAWMMQNIYNAYQYYPDLDTLKTQIYPMMKEAAQFYTHPNVLVPCPVSGRLVMSPTYSSEHGPMWGGATFQQQLLWQLFTDVAEAANTLGIDAEFAEDLLAKRELLGPVPKAPTSGKTSLNGQDSPGVKEWFWESAYYETTDGPIPGVENNHRHVSHIVGLYPGNLITQNTPEWMQWAKGSLNRRGDYATGWSRGHKMNLWARTGDGNRAYSIFDGLIKEATFENLWDFHIGPYFQIDGNLGGTAGMAELILQSHAGYIEPLAALPDVWPSGNATGLTTRGGFVVDISWEDKKLQKLRVKSSAGMDCAIKCDNSINVTENGNNTTIDVKFENGIATFATKKGNVYDVKFDY